MEEKVIIKALKMLDNLIGENLPKFVNIKLYPEILKEIPERFLEIEEVFPIDEIQEIIENFKSYLEEEYEDVILPILGIVGGNTICIGSDKNNINKVFYYSADFGVFKFNDSLDVFLSKLLDENTM